MIATLYWLWERQDERGGLITFDGQKYNVCNESESGLLGWFCIHWGCCWVVLYALGTALLVMVQTAYLLSANISLQLTLTGKSKFEVHV